MAEILPRPKIVLSDIRNELENGTFKLNGLSLTSNILTPNTTLKTDASSVIYSSVLTTSDISGFDPINYVEKSTIIQQDINSKLTAPTLGTTNHTDVDVELTGVANFIATKGTSNGLCPLVSSLIPDVYIPPLNYVEKSTIIQQDINSKLTAPTLGTTNHTDVDVELTGVANFIATKGTSNGLCPLSGGLIPNTYIPPLAISKPTVYASIALRDADTADEGDVAIVTDVGKSFIYTGTNYVELITTGSISSINGKSGGVVVIDTDEINEVGDSRYYTAARDALKVDVSTLSGVLTPTSLTIPEINYTPISVPTEVGGKVYFDSTDKLLKYYDGVQWVEMGTNIIVESHASMTSRSTPSPYYVNYSGSQSGRNWGVFQYPFNVSTGTDVKWWSPGNYDNTTGSYTGSSGLNGITEPGEWITIDHGNSEHICRMALKYNSNTVENFNIVYSNDGITYDSAHRQLGVLTGNASNEYTITFPCIRARYWGFQVDSISPSAGVNNSAIIDGLTFYRIKIEKTLQTDVNTLSDLLTPEMLSIPAVVYNPVVEPSAEVGKVYFDSTDKVLKYNNGYGWFAMGNNLITQSHPTMTSDNTPSPYIVTYSSSQYSQTWQVFEFPLSGYTGWAGYQNRYNSTTGAFTKSTTLPGVAGTGDWLVLDHSETVLINRLELIQGGGGSPATFSVIYSSDGVNYNTAYNQSTAVAVNTWGTSIIIDFVPVYGRYWGIMVHTTDGGGNTRCTVRGMKFFKLVVDTALELEITSRNANQYKPIEIPSFIADPSHVSHSSANGSLTGDKAFNKIYTYQGDDSYNNGWTKAVSATAYTLNVDGVNIGEQYVYIDLDTYSTSSPWITSFIVYCRADLFPTIYHIVGSNDETNWVSMFYTSGTTYEYEDPPEVPVITNRLAWSSETATTASKYYRYVGILLMPGSSSDFVLTELRLFSNRENF
jgi:hypothetical protein